MKIENIPVKYHGIVKAALFEYESGEPIKYDESEAIEYAGYMMDLINLAEI